MFIKVEVKFGKYPCLYNEWTNSYTFGITTLSITLSNVWVRPALGKIVYCENITTYIKPHLNSKYAMDFFLRFLQEMKQKYITKINNASRKKVTLNLLPWV